MLWKICNVWYDTEEDNIPNIILIALKGAAASKLEDIFIFCIFFIKGNLRSTDDSFAKLQEVTVPSRSERRLHPDVFLSSCADSGLPPEEGSLQRHVRKACVR